MKRPEPIYIGPHQDLMYHLGLVAGTVSRFIHEEGRGEPDRILTDWRDDGRGEASGWITVITWPIEVKG